MTRTTAIGTLILLTGCLPFQPARDTSVFVRLEADLPPETGPRLYPAPVRVTDTPGYLDQATVWTADLSGKLSPVPDYLWANPLPDSIQRNLSLLLSQSTPYPSDFSLSLRIDHFLLLSDGSGEAVLTGTAASKSGDHPLPLIRVQIENAWRPGSPATFLEGYRKLLHGTGKELKQQLSSLVNSL